MARISSEAGPDAARGRLSRRLAERSAQGRRLLVPYVTAGYPTRDVTSALMAGLVDAGADIIEVGVPFSDPLADGPVIQRTSQVALDHGGSLTATLATLRDFRAGDSTTPVVLFTYLNPVFRHGAARFLAEAVDAGADGVLLTDLPAGEDPALEEAFESSSLALVRLIAPTTPRQRALEIAARAQGFLYYISRTGVTGARADVRVDLASEVAALRAAASVPVVVGFGISTPEQAAEVGGLADGVVVGSALMEVVGEGGVDAAVAFLARLRAALPGG